MEEFLSLFTPCKHNFQHVKKEKWGDCELIEKVLFFRHLGNLYFVGFDYGDIYFALEACTSFYESVLRLGKLGRGQLWLPSLSRRTGCLSNLLPSDILATVPWTFRPALPSNQSAYGLNGAMGHQLFWFQLVSDEYPSRSWRVWKANWAIQN
jgi:hypothetical protein